MNNTVCRNFNYNEKVDGVLELISLNCERCEFDGHCDIKTTYYNAKDYVISAVSFKGIRMDVKQIGE